VKYVVAFLFCLAVGATSFAFVFHNRYKHSLREIHTLCINPKVLEEKLGKAPPAWMMRQIQKDLAPLASGISKEMIDEGFYGKKIEQFSLVRFTIQDGHITIAHDEKNVDRRHFKELVEAIKKLNHYVKLPNVDFVVSLEDGFGENPGIGPCLVFAKREDAKDLILIPDINALAGYGKLRDSIPKANLAFPWEQKRDQCFWRGSTTGGYSTLANWDKLSRTQLVLLSLSASSLLDARFNHVVQCDPEIPQMMKGKGMMSPSVSRKDHLQYKYLVDVDGNSCSFERYFWLLLSNSLVLKQMSPNVQWYYGGLEPYKHYVPVKSDLSDLLEKIQWAQAHDEEAKLMAEEATRFVEENLSPEDTLLYLSCLLKEYAALQKNLLN
jgi:hypothetical protein